MVEEKKKSGATAYSEALDLLFNSQCRKDVAIRFESGGYVLSLVIRDGATEVIVCGP